MDPLTVTSAVALLILTKAVEKTGEQLGEKVIQVGNAMWQSLREQRPTTATEIVKIAEASNFSEPQPVEELATSRIVNDIQQLADEDENFRRVVEAASHQWQIQNGGINNSAKIAEKIGFLNQGSVINSPITQNF